MGAICKFGVGLRRRSSATNFTWLSIVLYFKFETTKSVNSAPQNHNTEHNLSALLFLGIFVSAVHVNCRSWSYLSGVHDIVLCGIYYSEANIITYEISHCVYAKCVYQWRKTDMDINMDISRPMEIVCQSVGTFTINQLPMFYWLFHHWSALSIFPGQLHRYTWP